MNFKFDIGQRVRFSTTPYDWEVYSRNIPKYGREPQYYLQSMTRPNYHQWVLESDLREVSDVT